MEAVPRLPMISFELKLSPEYVDFGPILKQYIRDHYGEDPAHYNKACNDLEQLRQSAIHVSHDFMGCSTLKKYYAQLQFLQGRFPMVDGGEAAMPFTWDDLFAREVTLTLADIKFEQASVLYNIGSLHSILGAMETRQNADGMKVSCTHFQCAAWAYEYLRDHFGAAMMSHDFSHDLLTFHFNLMLAQAQECILEKSMIDSRKSSITAKVAMQIVEFYNLSLKALDPAYKDGIVSSRRHKEWKRRIDLKVLFYTCITYFYIGKQSEDQQKWGECLAYYTLSFNKLTDCIKLGKNESSDIQESLRFANDVVQGKYQSAKKDNDFVYHEKVPDLNSLPEVKGAPLVKGIPFNPNDPEISGPDIFQKLVPMEAHEASSLYSEEKAKLLREVCGEIEEKNTRLTQFMSSLNLDQSKLNNIPDKLPQQLLEKCAAVSVKPNAIKDLVEAMGAVSNVATDVYLSIKEIHELLEKEREEEEEFQEQFGKRKVNPNFDEIRKELARFEEGHKKGSQSNTDLHRAMNTHTTNLRLLGGPIEDINNALPSVGKAKDPEDDAVVDNLRRLLGKVEEMKEQRNSLEEQLRKQVMEDDITNAIVTQEGQSKQVMFDKELKKHDKLIGVIKQNLTAQENILAALTDANAKYANIRRASDETAARREAMIGELINSYDIYEDLLAKSQKGHDFYKKLEGNVSRLLGQCKELCQRNSEERQKFLDKYKPKVVAPVRPDAPKPAATPKDPPSMTSSPSLPEDMEPSLASTIPPMSSLPSISGFDGPKLKDYLPFMKPKTFGKDRKQPKGSSSLPGSHSGSPIRMPAGSDTLGPKARDDFSLPHDLDSYMDGQLHASSVPSIHATNWPGNLPRNLPSQSHLPPGPTPGTDARLPEPGPGSTHSMHSVGGGMSAQIDPAHLKNWKGQGMQGVQPDPYPQMRPSPSHSPQVSTSYLPHSSPLQSPAMGTSPVPPPDYANALQDSKLARLQGGFPQRPNVSGVDPRLQYSQSVVDPRIPHSQSMMDPRNQISQSMVDPRNQISQSMVDPRTPLSQSMVDPRTPHSESMVDPRTPHSQSMVDPRNQISQSMVDPRTAHSQSMVDPRTPHSQSMVDPRTQQLQSMVDPRGQSPAGMVDSRTQLPQHMMDPRSQSPHDGMDPRTNVPQGSMSQYHSFNQSLSSSASQQGYSNSPSTTVYSGVSYPSHHVSSSSSQYTFTTSQNQAFSQGQGQNWQAPQGQSQQVPQGQGQHQQVPQDQGQSQQVLQSQGQFQQVPYSQGQIQQFQQGHGHGSFQPQVTYSGGTNTVSTIHTPVITPANAAPPFHQHYSDVPASSQQNVYQPTTSITGQTQNRSMMNQQFRQQPYGDMQSMTSQSQQMPMNNQVDGNVSSANRGQGQMISGQGSYQNQSQYPQGQQWQQNYQPQQGNQSNTRGQQQGQFQTQQGQQSQGQSHQGQLQQGPQNFSQMQQPQGNIQQPQQPHSKSHGQILYGHQGNMLAQQDQQSGNVGQGQVMSGQMQQGQQTNNQTQYGQQRLQGQTHQQMYSQGQQGLQSQGQGQPPSQPQHKYPQMQQGHSLMQQQPGQSQQGYFQQQQQQQQHPQIGMQQQQPQFQQNQQQQPQNRPLQQQTQQQIRSMQPGQGHQAVTQQQQPTSQLQPQNSQMQHGQQPSLQQQTSQAHGSQAFHQSVPPQQQQQMQPNYGQMQHGYTQLHQGQGQNQQPQVQQQNISQQRQQQFTGGTQQQYIPPTSMVTSQPSNVGSQQHQVAASGSGSFSGQFPGQQQSVPSSVYPGTTSQGQGYYGPQGQTHRHSGGQQLTDVSQQQYGQTSQVGTSQQPSQRFMSGQGQMQQGHQPSQGSSMYSMSNPLSPDVLPQGVLPTPIQPSHPQSGSTPRTGSSIDDLSDLTVTSTTTAPIPMDQGKVQIPRKDNSVSTGRKERSHSRQLSASSTTSLDDILSSSPTPPQVDKKDTAMLTPKVLTEQEKQQQKEEALLKSSLARQTSRDPYSDPLVKDRFVGEVEKFAKYVESLKKATCSGPTNLDVAWKELIEEQEKGGKRTSMAIARCYPAKNRDVDVMPYDETRVVLTTLKDDYINASWITDLSPCCPKFIATQSPLPVTLTDFWVAVYEQGSEVIVMLSSETETGKKFPEYWPSKKGQMEHHGPVALTLQSEKDKNNWIERIIYLNHLEKKQARTIVQLQYKNWPVSGFPDNISHLLQFITTVHNFYRQQRSLLKPVIVHCSNGIGRTGVFMLVYAGMQEMDHGSGIVNILEVAKKMFMQRRLAIKEKYQLKYVYEAILYYAQDILAKKGILVHKASFGDKLPHPKDRANQWTPTEDILFGTTMSLNALQSNVAKLGLHIGEASESKSEVLKSSTTDVKNVSVSETVTSQVGEKTGSTERLAENLPDVVQQEPKTKTELRSEVLQSDKTNVGSPKLSRNASNSSLKSLESASVKSLDSESLRSLETGSIKSLESGSVSHESSPAHKASSGQDNGGNKHLSLVDLQDPKNFTVGTNEGSKKKFTKASFQNPKPTLTENVGDPCDPLSSLDPLWSLKK